MTEIEFFPQKLGVGGLNPAAEIFYDYISDQSGNGCDCKIVGRKDIDKSKRQSFSLPVRPSELSHQQVGIKQKYDEADFDQRSPDRRQMSWLLAIRRRGC
jgi:hypothetical protein